MGYFKFPLLLRKKSYHDSAHLSRLHFLINIVKYMKCFVSINVILGKL